MAAAASHARAATPAPRHERDAHEDAPDFAYRAPRTRRRAQQRLRLTRTFVVFVVVLTALAVGRVALSFAVVQKTLQTDAVVSRQRQASAANQDLQAQVASLASTVRIRQIAQSQLGLVSATTPPPLYLTPLPVAGQTGKVASTR